ncbi:MAG: endonuclease/exonuclease/phosphatase family protein [Polyangiaceae bacterium]
MSAESEPRTRAQRFWATADILGQQYVACMGLALLFQLTLRDSTSLFFAASSLALYFFAPLPLLVLIALKTRRRELLVGALILALVWLWQWGRLFSPLRLREPSRVELRVATYNLLGRNHSTASTVHELELANADLVSLQELNLEQASAIEKELGGTYPYRQLDPRVGVRGSGVLSRWPLEAVDTRLRREYGWVGKPMVFKVTIEQRQLYFVQFHAASGTGAFEARENQAEELRDFARTADLPVIAAGDFNATDTSRAYSIAREGLNDAWRTAGFGFGHTFPGEPGPEAGGSRPTIAGFPVPKWLIRIDFIFHTDQLVAQEAAIVPSGGGSDHRMVTASFSWR